MEKLVRDNIPTIMCQNGQEVVSRTASALEYWHLLFVKLQEEIVEFAQNPCAEELADIMEVILALAESMGISEESIRKERLKKKEASGGFSKRIVLVKK